MIALTIFYYIISLQPMTPSEPLRFWGPLSRADCKAIERGTSGSFCHSIHVRTK